MQVFKENTHSWKRSVRTSESRPGEGLCGPRRQEEPELPGSKSEKQQRQSHTSTRCQRPETREEGQGTLPRQRGTVSSSPRVQVRVREGVYEQGRLEKIVVKMSSCAAMF